MKGQAQDYLNYLFSDESEIDIRASIMPTLLSVTAAGTGFRMPFVTHFTDEGQPSGKNGRPPRIGTHDVDFFEILPAPNSGLVNPIDRNDADALDSFIRFTWYTDAQIRALAKFPGYVQDQAEECLKQKPDAQGGLRNEYIDKYTVLGGVNYGTSKTDWRQKMNDVGGTSGRRRVAIWYKRDGMEIYAQDYWKVYKGPAVLPHGLLPLVAYKAVPDFKNLYGISNLEMVEDLFIAMMMNFNFRMDYLARIMFPTKWLRNDVMAGKSERDLFFRPDQVLEFPQSVQRIQDAIFYDRMPEITGQTFMDETSMRQFSQQISGIPNYAAGAPSQGTIENRTATGIVSLIRQAEGRLTAESQALEEFGLRQEARLLLAMAEQHIIDDMDIRSSKPSGGFIFSTVEAEALADMYTVHIHGTRYQSDREQQFQ